MIYLNYSQKVPAHIFLCVTLNQRDLITFKHRLIITSHPSTHTIPASTVLSIPANCWGTTLDSFKIKRVRDNCTMSTGARKRFSFIRLILQRKSNSRVFLETASAAVDLDLTKDVFYHLGKNHFHKQCKDIALFIKQDQSCFNVRLKQDIRRPK